MKRIKLPEKLNKNVDNLFSTNKVLFKNLDFGRLEGIAIDESYSFSEFNINISKMGIYLDTMILSESSFKPLNPNSKIQDFSQKILLSRNVLSLYRNSRQKERNLLEFLSRKKVENYIEYDVYREDSPEGYQFIVTDNSLVRPIYQGDRDFFPLYLLIDEASGGNRR